MAMVQGILMIGISILRWKHDSPPKIKIKIMMAHQKELLSPPGGKHCSQTTDTFIIFSLFLADMAESNMQGILSIKSLPSK